jgi:hypothetical protein
LVAPIAQALILFAFHNRHDEGEPD